MVKHIAVFLRGVNVNNTRMKMEELRAAFNHMGYINTKTLLGSGNAVVTTEDDDLSIRDHKEKIEMGLSLYFGYEAYVIVKDIHQLLAIVEEAEGHKIPEGYHHYLMLSNDSTLGAELKAIHAQCKIASDETLLLEPSGIYWIVPKGQTLDSEFGEKVLGKKEFKSRLTSRTMNTVLKVKKALQERCAL